MTPTIACRILVALTLLLPAMSFATTYKVPSQKADIQTALGTAGVTLVQVDGTFTNSGVVTMVNGVRVERDPTTAGTPTIDASANTSAVIFPFVSSASTVLSGFDITNFTTNGVILSSSSSTPGRVEYCVIENGVTGVSATNAAVEVVECTIRGQSSNGVYTSGSNHATSLIQDNLIVVQTSANTFGIKHDAAGSQGPLIQNNTVGSGDFGIWIKGSNSVATVVENNLVVVAITAGIKRDSGLLTVSHNIAWGAGSSANYVGCSGNPPTGNSDHDPMLCDSTDYKVSINSWCTVPSSPWGERAGQIANIGCTTNSSLLYSTTLADREQIVVNSDFTIPLGKTLTVGPGVSFKFDAADETTSNYDVTRNEIVVAGSFIVAGTAQDPVRFVAQNPTYPADYDWYAVLNPANGDTIEHLIQIDHAYFANSEYGVFFSQPGNNCSITNSTFENNEIAIGAYLSQPWRTQTVSGNTITLGSADELGMSVTDLGAITIEDNVINGHANALAGIEMTHVSFGATAPLVRHNIISGFTNGKGIDIHTSSYPTVVKNTIYGNKYGIYVSGSANPKIGSAADTTSDNIVTGCSNAGLYVTGSGTTGTVRQSRFTSNFVGIVTASGANPNLGTSGSYGKNISLDNTSYCIWNRSSSGTISAQGNYMGSGGYPLCPSGLVDITNYLGSVPASTAIGLRQIGENEAPLQMQEVTPNPLSTSSVIRFVLGKAMRSLRVTVYDVGGRLVKSFGERQLSAGYHEVEWDGTADTGARAPSGLYLVRIVGDGAAQGTRKLLVSR